MYFSNKLRHYTKRILFKKSVFILVWVEVSENIWIYWGRIPGMLLGISRTIMESSWDELVGTLMYCYLFSCNCDGIWFLNSMSQNCLIVVQIYMDQHLHIKITTVAKYLKMSKKLQIVE